MTNDDLVTIIYALQPSAIVQIKSALLAVVELHKPYNSVNACTFDDLDYPCPTIQAIEKELE